MEKGPILNDTSYNFTTRDPLGIEGVYASIAAEICPVVNTVTPRAFYWAFMVWNFYDFHKYSGIKEKTDRAFNDYLKKQDYYFVLSVLLNKTDETNLVGKTKASEDIERIGDGDYPYNDKYFKSNYGGMQYYYAGCLTLGFVTTEDNEGNKYSFPMMTRLGEQLALAFEDVIKDTEYYKIYHTKDTYVPKSVLMEYGKKIRLDMKGFDRCIEILRKVLFESKRNHKLYASSHYLLGMVKMGSLEALDTKIVRGLLYDHLFPDGTKTFISEEDETISKEWEIAVGRQYFTLGLEMIWKYMMDSLDDVMTAEDWINMCLKESNFAWDDAAIIEDVIDDCEFGFEQREGMIDSARKNRSRPESIENGFRIMLSVYNRFANDDKYEKQSPLFGYGYDSSSISLHEFFDLVERNKSVEISEVLSFIMKNWLIDQHYRTAFEKMLQRRNGFFYEILDGRYMKTYEFGIDYQGNRLVQLFQVMNDLKMI